MEITKEFIELCKNAPAVQDLWEPKRDDLCVIFIGKFSHPYRMCYKVFQKIPLHHLKKQYLFLPDASWCANQIARMGKLKGINSRQKGERWVISISMKETFKPKDMIYFCHADYDTVHLMAAEFVLSEGKNDLRV